MSPTGRTTCRTGPASPPRRWRSCGRSRPTGAPGDGCSSIPTPSRSPGAGSGCWPAGHGSRSSGPAAAWVYDRVAGPGPRPSAVARTRFIDDAVTDRAPAVDQLVLLGAGLRHPCAPAPRGRRSSRPSRSTTRRRRRARSRSSPVKASTPVGSSTCPVDFERDRLDARSLGARGSIRRARRCSCGKASPTTSPPPRSTTTLAVVRDAGRAGERARVHLRARRACSTAAATFPEAERWVQQRAARR